MSGTKSLHDALRPPDVAQAEELCADNSVDVNEMKKVFIRKETPLMICCRESRDDQDSPGYQYLRILGIILKHPQQNLNIKDDEELTGLHYICDKRNPPSVTAAKMLLSKEDAPVNGQDWLGWTPLMYCARNARDQHGEDGSLIADKYVRIMKLILKHPKHNSKVVDTGGFTALHWICQEQKSVLAVQLLLKQPDICISAQADHGFTPLHVLICYDQKDKTATIKVLILKEFVKHPNIKDYAYILDNAGMNILDRFLLNNTFNADGIALANSGKAILGMLLRINGLVNASGMTLALCATLASSNAFKILLNSGAHVNDSLPGGETTAHCVIQKNSLSKFRMLLSHNPDLSRIWNYKTPRQLAISIGCKIEILYELGLNEPSRNQRPNTIGEIQASHDHHDNVCPFTATRDVYSPHLSCNIKVDAMHKTHVLSHKLSTPIPLYVKHNQCLLRKKSKEVQAIRLAVDTIFVQFAKQLRESKTCSHFAFKHFLCGSSADNTKCFEPDEMDFVCEFESDVQSQYIHSTGEYVIHSRRDSGWAAHCDSDGKLNVKAASQAFYCAFAQLCHEYQPITDDQDKGISDVSFQFMSKISRIKCIWNGVIFKDMAVYADVVPAFVAHDYEPENVLPLGATCSKYFAIGKADRHTPNNVNPTVFPISYCKAKYQMMTSLSAPLQQGFLIAKAMRLAATCAPGFDLKALYVVEDLSIEDYITSYALKTCLLILLQHMCAKAKRFEKFDELMINAAKTTHCKYRIADIIYRIFKAALESDDKTLRVWYNRVHPVFSCFGCADKNKATNQEQSADDDVYKVCCRKRLVRLALIHKISTWLSSVDNLRTLHDSDDCTCEYSSQEWEDHQTIMARLENTGKLLTTSAHSEFSDDKQDTKVTTTVDRSKSSYDVVNLNCHIVAEGNRITSSKAGRERCLVTSELSKEFKARVSRLLANI